jgi:hypothetical protein
VPKLAPDKVNKDDLVGVEQIDTTITFDDRMRKYWKPHDTVKVLNFDDEAIQWQVLDEENETYTIEDGTNIKIVARGDPDLWRIEAGDMDVLDGYIAYRMMDALFKKMTAKKVGPNEHPLDQRDIKIFDFADPQSQERFIRKCFLGKITPQQMKEYAMRGFDNATEKAPKPARRVTASPKAV